MDKLIQFNNLFQSSGKFLPRTVKAFADGGKVFSSLCKSFFNNDKSARVKTFSQSLEKFSSEWKVFTTSEKVFRLGGKVFPAGELIVGPYGKGFRTVRNVFPVR